MANSVDNIAVALILERARRIAGKKKRKKKWHNKTLGRLLPT